MKKITAFLEDIEDGRFTAGEIVLSGIVLFLLGILLGVIFTPRRTQVFGSYNGSNFSDDVDYIEEDEVIED